MYNLIDIFYFHSFPAESSRPYLRHIENVENSDYINACYVDVSVPRMMLFEIHCCVLINANWFQNIIFRWMPLIVPNPFTFFLLFLPFLFCSSSINDFFLY